MAFSILTDEDFLAMVADRDAPAELNDALLEMRREGKIQFFDDGSGDPLIVNALVSNQVDFATLHWFWRAIECISQCPHYLAVMPVADCSLSTLKISLPAKLIEIFPQLGGQHGLIR